MKKNNSYILVAILIAVVAVSGCAQMRDKFIRNPKKKEDVGKMHHVVIEQDVRPSLDLYIKRYIFWKNWHSELLAVLSDENRKKAIVAVEHDISNLMDMRNMLVDEKAAKLQVVIDEMTGIETNIQKRRAAAGGEVRIRKRLEALGRKIRRNFSYNRIKGFIRSDWKEQGD